MTDYQKIKQKINGPIFSVVTPFLENEDIDFESVEKYLEYAYKQGAQKLLCNGIQQ